MLQEQLTPEEIKLRSREDRYIQEGKKDYERVARARAVSEARQERAKSIGDQTETSKNAEPV